MIAHCEWKGNGFFEGQSGSGYTLEFDVDPAHSQGASPMEAVLMGLCGCTSAAVVSILEKKRQTLTGLRVTARATRAESAPSVFTGIKLTYTVSGAVSRKAVEDAVGLSKNKYCPVSKMLEKTAKIDCEIVYVDGELEP